MQDSKLQALEIVAKSHQGKEIENQENKDLETPN